MDEHGRERLDRFAQLYRRAMVIASIIRAKQAKGSSRRSLLE
jgi:hypothetical protein